MNSTSRPTSRPGARTHTDPHTDTRTDTQRPHRTLGSRLGELRVLIGLLVVAFLAVLAGATVYASYTQRSNLYESRRDLLTSVGDSATNTVRGYVEAAESGEMTAAEAQAAASRALASMRYGDGDYVWIHDDELTMVMHPAKPELDGTSVAGITDPTGEPLFARLTDVAVRDGSGFVDYLWPRPGSDEPVAKTSYVTYVPEWGWIVGTGVYVDDIRAQVMASVVRITLFGVGGFLAVALMSWWVVRGVMRPVREASETLERVADGDLTPRLDVRTHDELGDLRRAVNHTLDEITGALTAVHESTFTLAGAAEELTATSGELARSATSTTEASQRAHELIGLVGASAGEATTVADRAASVTADMNSTITDLGTSSLEIGNVVEVITSIAEQTNLLALNATIEAARAGQAGRGFAVVADEVKQLARQTTDATHEIRARVEGIQSVTSQAVDAIALVSETIGQIDQIQSKIAEHVDGGGTGDGITSHIGDLRNSAERTSSASQDTLDAANELTQLAARLSTHLARFHFEPRTAELVGAGHD